MAAFAALLLSSSVCNHTPRVERHFAFYPNTHLFYQALALKVPSARLNHFSNNPQWSTKRKLKYLQSERLLETPQAKLYFAQTLYDNKDYDRALLWLKNTAVQQNQQATVLRAKTLLALSRYREVVSMKDDINHSLRPIVAQAHYYLGQFDLAKKLLDESDDEPSSQLKAQIDIQLNRQVVHDECRLNIQFLISDYLDLKYANDIMKQWQNDAALNQLPVCIAKVRSFDPQQLDCTDDIDSRAYCDMTLMAKHLNLSDDILPVIVQGKQAKANYNNGVIFINHARSYGVFKHELMHHFGFMDEYPLPLAVANRLCHVEQAQFVGENLYVMPKATAKTARPKGMVPVRACENVNVVAYKPVVQMTLMEFMDQPLPAKYIDKADKRLRLRPDTFANYQYGFALAFKRKGKIKHYQHWLKRSAKQGYGVAESMLSE